MATPHPSSKPVPILVTIAFAYMYVAWGVTYLAIHDAVETIPPFIMAGSRVFIAGTLMLALLRFLRPAEFRWGTVREWKDAAIVGILLMVGGNGVQAWCQKLVPVSITALLFGMIPLWIILFDWIRPHGVAPTRRTLAGLVLGFVGVVVLVNPRGENSNTGSVFWWEILLLLAGCSFAAGGIYSRYAQASGSPLLPMARQMIVAGVVMLAISVLSHQWNHFSLAQVTLSSWLGFGYLVTFGSLVGYTCFVWLMRVSTPAHVATISYGNLLIAVLLGWWLLHEAMTLRLLIGGTITVGSVALVLKRVKRVHEIAEE